MIRASALAILLLATPASSQPVKIEWTCTEVKAFIERYGWDFALRRARMAGLTAADVERIKKRCDLR